MEEQAKKPTIQEQIDGIVERVQPLADKLHRDCVSFGGDNDAVNKHVEEKLRQFIPGFLDSYLELVELIGAEAAINALRPVAFEYNYRDGLGGGLRRVVESTQFVAALTERLRNASGAIVQDLSIEEVSYRIRGSLLEVT